MYRLPGEPYTDVGHGSTMNCRMYYVEQAESATGDLAENCQNASPSSVQCQYTPFNHCTAPIDVVGLEMPFLLEGTYSAPAMPTTCQGYPGSGHWMTFTPSESGTWTIWSDKITGMAVYSDTDCVNILDPNVSVDDKNEIACKIGFLDIQPLEVDLVAGETFLMQMYHSSSGGLFFIDPSFHFYAPGTSPF